MEVTPSQDGHLTKDHSCINCQDRFVSTVELKAHQSLCELRSATQESGKMVDVSKEEHINEVDEAIKHSQDAVNNNVHSEESRGRLEVNEGQEDIGADTPKDDTNSLIETKNSSTAKKTPRSGSPAEPVNEEEDGADVSGSFTQNHVTLEALQNTKVAVAQFAANALAGAGNGDNEAALKDLAVLHSTLFQLQHQHVFQLQLIQQLQSQLSMNNRGKEDEDKEEEMDDRKSHQSEGSSEKRDDEEDEDFEKLEPEVIISRYVA